MIKDAEFSPCQKYRYQLSRVWDPGGMLIVWVMLNPSVADAARNDPTVTRLIKRAQSMSLGGLVVVNLFAWVSTHPDALLKVTDPIGPGNDVTIINLLNARKVAYVALGWGQISRYPLARQRAANLVNLMLQWSRTPLCLGVTKEGYYPRHPLHVAYSVQLRPYQ
jgi:hypothetical protein